MSCFKIRLLRVAFPCRAAELEAATNRVLELTSHHANLEQRHRIFTLAGFVAKLGVVCHQRPAYGLANRKVDSIGRAVAAISLGQLVAAVCVILLWVVGDRPAVDLSMLPIESIPLLQELAFKLDGPTALMFGLISFIGWVIVHYSLRYLHGDANQGRFFKQFAFTLASVNLLVWSSSLAMFTAAWFGVSIGLHALLLHFGNRTGAKRAAWLKFTVSRSGEVLLVAAVAVLLSAYGTTQFTELASLAQAYSNGVTSEVSSHRYRLHVGW